MKKSALIIGALILIMFSCTDLTDLENRLTDLENRVELIEKLNLSDLVLSIETMQGKVNNSDSAIDSLQKQITEINSELSDVNSGGDTDIYWGDVLNDESFNAISEGNYKKITGKVRVTKNEQIPHLQDVTFIGSDLSLSDISGDVTFEALEVVSGSINISDISLSGDTLKLAFPKLTGICNNLTTEAETTYNLHSLDLPLLAVVGGNLSLDLPMQSAAGTPEEAELVNNAFSSLNIPALSLVGLNFEIKGACKIEELHIITTFIGGDFHLFNNGELSLANSEINSLKRVEGSIILKDNYHEYSSVVPPADLQKVTLFNDLEYLGNSFMFEGSDDLYKIDGFNMLTIVPGDIIITSAMMGVAFNSSDKFFSALEGVGGDLSISLRDPETKTTEDASNKPKLRGFESLTHVDGDLYLVANQIYGFEKLEYTGLAGGGIDTSRFTVDCDFIPEFPALYSINGENAVLELHISMADINDIFPLFGEKEDASAVSIEIDLSNLTETQNISNSFNKIQRLGALIISSSSHKDEEFLKLTNSFTSLTTIASYPLVESNLLDIEVGLETDLSCLRNYFIAKATDYNTAKKEYEEYVPIYNLLLDSYEKALIKYNNGEIAAKPEFDYAVPEIIGEQSSNISIHSEDKLNTEGVTHFYYNDEYTIIKTDDTDEEHDAIIQCFKKYGKFEDYSELESIRPEEEE